MGLHREKLKDTIVFIACHPSVRDLGLTKLYKLLYFADVAHLRDRDATITGSDYIKYEHGPVPSRAERCIKQLRKEGRLVTAKIPYAGYELTSIRCAGPGAWTSLSSDEIETLDSVCRHLGAETATCLSERSHAEPAWVGAPMLEKLSTELMLYGAAEDPDGL